MSQRTRAGLLALCLLAVLWGDGRLRAAALRHLLPRTDRRHPRREGRGRDRAGHRAPGLLRRRRAADDHRLRQPARGRRHAPRAAARLLRPRRRGLAALVGLCPRRDRRVERPRVRRRDGVLPGHRDRGSADRARRGGRPHRRGPRRHARACPAEDRLKVRDILLEVGGIEITEAQDVVDAVDGAAGGADPVRRTTRGAGGQRRRHPGRRSTGTTARRHHARRRLRLPLPGERRHRRQHRRAQRRPDDVAGDLRHPHARLDDRRRATSPAPAPSRRPARSARSAASSRRSPPRATPAPSSSSCPPTTATASGEWTPATCGWPGRPRCTAPSRPSPTGSPTPTPTLPTCEDTAS